ncbi:lysine-specific demethylase hairless [Pleurodeles waltl]
MDLEGQQTSPKRRRVQGEPSGPGRATGEERRGVQQPSNDNARHGIHQGNTEVGESSRSGNGGARDHPGNCDASSKDYPRYCAASESGYSGNGDSKEADTSENDTDREDGSAGQVSVKQAESPLHKFQAFCATGDPCHETRVNRTSPSTQEHAAFPRREEESPSRLEAFPVPTYRKRRNVSKERGHNSADTPCAPRNGEGMRDWLGRLAGQAPTWAETLAGSQASSYAHPYIYPFPVGGLETKGMLMAEKPTRAPTVGTLPGVHPPQEDTRTHEALRRLSAHCHLITGVKLFEGHPLFGPTLDSMSGLEEAPYSGSPGSIPRSSLGSCPPVLEDSHFVSANWHLGLYPPAWSHPINHIRPHHRASVQPAPENVLSARRKECSNRRESVLHPPAKDPRFSPVKTAPGLGSTVHTTGSEEDRLPQYGQMAALPYLEYPRGPSWRSEAHHLDSRTPLPRAKTAGSDTQSYRPLHLMEHSLVGSETSVPASSELQVSSPHEPASVSSESKEHVRSQSANQSITSGSAPGDRLPVVYETVESRRATIFAHSGPGAMLLPNHSQRDGPSEHHGMRSGKYTGRSVPGSCRDGEPCGPMSTRTPVEEGSRSGHSSKSGKLVACANPPRNHTKMKQTWLSRHSEQFSGHTTNQGFRSGKTQKEDQMDKNVDERGLQQAAKRPCDCISEEEPRGSPTEAKRSRPGEAQAGGDLEESGAEPKDIVEPKCSADLGDGTCAPREMYGTKSGDQTHVSLQSVPCIQLPEGTEHCYICKSQSQEATAETSCRFLHFRRLVRRLDGKLEADGLSTVDEAEDEDARDVVPRDRTRNPSPAKYLLSTLGDQFCEIISRDREALSWNQQEPQQIVACRKVFTGPQICDACQRAFFNSHWICSRCGFQMCLECQRSKEKALGKDPQGEEEQEKKCARGHDHSLSFLVPAQFISTQVLSHLWKVMHDMRVKYNINANCHCRQTFLTDAVLLGISLSKEKELKGTQTPPLQPGDYEEKPELKVIKEECTEPAEQSLSDEGPKAAAQNSTLCDLLTSTAVKLCLGQTGVRMAFAPVSSALPTDDRISSILDNIIAQVVERKIQERQQVDTQEVRSSSPPESSLQYPVPHQGGILWLQDPGDTNYRRFQEHWRQCQQPVLISGLNKNMKRILWGLEHLSGELRPLLPDTSPASRTPPPPDSVDSKEFWEGFIASAERLQLEKTRGIPRKGERNIEELRPSWLENLTTCLPLPEYCHPRGKLNLASYMLADQLWLCPRISATHGMKFDNRCIGTKNLAAEVADFLNILVHSEDPGGGFSEGQSFQQEILLRTDSDSTDGLLKEQLWTSREPPGALWHIFQAEDSEQIRRFLKRVCADQTHPSEDRSLPSDHQSCYLDLPLRRRLQEECGVKSWALLQFLGDAVVVPAGSPYQVHNFTNTISITQAFLSPENASLSAHLMRSARKTQPSTYNFSAQIEGAVFGAVKEAVEILQAYN